MSQLDRNTATLNELLELAQNLPEAGTALPELENPGSAAELLTGKELIDGDGNVVAGTMPNNGAVSKTLDVTATSYTIPEGYHNGSGTVSIKPVGLYAVPTKEAQTITPPSGKVLSEVIVNPIPDQYADVSGLIIEPQDVANGTEFIDRDGNRNTGKLKWNKVYLEDTDGGDWLTANSTASVQDGEFYYSLLFKPNLGTVAPDKVLKGETFSSVYDGNVYVNVEGTMPNNGAVQQSIDVMTGVESAPIAKGYHNGEGVVRIADTLHTALGNVAGIEPDLEIRNNVEALNTNVAAQASLISQIQTALEGKAAGGGGGSVETCTVEIAADMAAVGLVYVSPTLDGTYTRWTISEPGDTPPSFETACGSIIYLSSSYATTTGCTGQNFECAMSYVFVLTAKSGETVIIRKA